MAAPRQRVGRKQGSTSVSRTDHTPRKAGSFAQWYSRPTLATQRPTRTGSPMHAHLRPRKRPNPTRSTPAHPTPPPHCCALTPSHRPRVVRRPVNGHVGGRGKADRPQRRRLDLERLHADERPRAGAEGRPHHLPAGHAQGGHHLAPALCQGHPRLRVNVLKHHVRAEPKAVGLDEDGLEARQHRRRRAPPPPLPPCPLRTDCRRHPRPQ